MRDASEFGLLLLLAGISGIQKGQNKETGSEFYLFIGSGNLQNSMVPGSDRFQLKEQWGKNKRDLYSSLPFTYLWDGFVRHECWEGNATRGSPLPPSPTSSLRAPASLDRPGRASGCEESNPGTLTVKHYCPNLQKGQ